MRMAKLLIQAETTTALAQEIRRVTGSEVLKVEEDGHTVYLALRRAGLTTAVVLTCTPLSLPMPDGENLAVKLEGEAENPAAARASRALTDLLTPAGLLFTPEGDWRARCAQWQARVQRAQGGDTLLGEYPDAVGYVGYNEIGKKAFEQDARRFLRQVRKLLGWPGEVTFNPSGIASSGDVYLHLTPPTGTGGVMIDVSAEGGFQPGGCSPSGVGLRWTLTPGEGQDRWAPAYRNRWARWTTTATQLADEIRAAQADAFPELKSA